MPINFFRQIICVQLLIVLYFLGERGSLYPHFQISKTQRYTKGAASMIHVASTIKFYTVDNTWCTYIKSKRKSLSIDGSLIGLITVSLCHLSNFPVLSLLMMCHCSVSGVCLCVTGGATQMCFGQCCCLARGPP